MPSGRPSTRRRTEFDPWATGLAWRRLRALPSPRFDLGAYGWVDAPRPAVAGGPFPAEYLHAPSEAQALTAAILRDRAVSDSEPGRWDMDLDSDRVRLAEQLAGEVRLGAHLSEALGRAVERVVGDRATIERLRAEHPIRVEHAGRRVCDGQAVLAARASDPASLGLTVAQLSGLGPLADALDTYGDLLVADAVFDVVSGRGEHAAAAMEAAAGLSVPPRLDVIRTQRQGRAVSTSVVVALPDAPAPPVGVATSPARIADPAVAAFLDTAFGAANGPAWTWHGVDESGTVLTTVTLAGLGLAPIDTIGLSADDLAHAVLDASGSPSVVPIDGLPAHQRTRRMADALGSQPAVPADLADAVDPPSDAAVHADLLARYTDLHATAGLLGASMAAAVGGSDADQRLALANARRWGITPLDLDTGSLATRTGRARDALATRIAGAPTPAAAAGLTVPDLAKAMAELAAAEGRVPVLARQRLDALPVGLTAEPAPTAGRPTSTRTGSRSCRRSGVPCLASRHSSSSAAPPASRPSPPGRTGPATRGRRRSRRARSRAWSRRLGLVAAFGPARASSTRRRSDPTGCAGTRRHVQRNDPVLGAHHERRLPLRRARRASAAGDPRRRAARGGRAARHRPPWSRSSPRRATPAHARMATPEEIDALAAALPLTMLPANSPAGVTLLPWD